jgi:hypothetical protein
MKGTHQPRSPQNPARLRCPARWPYQRAAFFHECFATWVQYDALVSSGRVPISLLKTTPVQPQQPYYELGKHLGAALAGSDANARHLSELAKRPTAQPAKRDLIEWARGVLKPPLTVDAVVSAYQQRSRG